MATALIALGSNLGDRRQHLADALARLSAIPGVQLRSASSWHETAPVGGERADGHFLNGAALVDTLLAPLALLAELQRIENALGRTRQRRWQARSIDLDLLLYDDIQIDSAQLTVPHPRMAFRRFMLAPAAEVASDMRHPQIDWSVGQLLHHLNATRPYVALLGPPGSGKSELAERLARELAGTFLVDPAAILAFDSAGESSGSEYQPQIQFLVRRAAALDQSDWSFGRTLVVSDFYFDQSLVFARRVLDAAGYARLEAEWQQYRSRSVQPRLLICLTSPVGLATADVELAAELTRLAARPGVGPVLWLKGNDRQAHFEEALAAVQAAGGG